MLRKTPSLQRRCSGGPRQCPSQHREALAFRRCSVTAKGDRRMLHGSTGEPLVAVPFVRSSVLRDISPPAITPREHRQTSARSGIEALVKMFFLHSKHCSVVCSSGALIVVHAAQVSLSEGVVAEERVKTCRRGPKGCSQRVWVEEERVEGLRCMR